MLKEMIDQIVQRFWVFFNQTLQTLVNSQTCLFSGSVAIIHCPQDCIIQHFLLFVFFCCCCLHRLLLLHLMLLLRLLLRHGCWLTHIQWQVLVEIVVFTSRHTACHFFWLLDVFAFGRKNDYAEMYIFDFLHSHQTKVTKKEQALDREQKNKMSNVTKYPAIPTNAAGLCHAYLEVYTQIAEHPEWFGAFPSEADAESYALTRLLVLFVGPAFLAFLAAFEFLPTGHASRSFFAWLRILEAILYLVLPIADAIFVFRKYNVASAMYQNTQTMMWLGLCLLLIVNSVYIVATLHHQLAWMERVMDLNWTLVGLILLGQFEGTYTSTLLNGLAGFLLVVSVTLFSPSSERYINHISQQQTKAPPERSTKQRVCASVLYILQCAAFILVCVSAHKAPVELIVSHWTDCPYRPIIYVLYGLTALEFLVLLSAVFYYHLSSSPLVANPAASFEQQPLLNVHASPSGATGGYINNTRKFHL